MASNRTKNSTPAGFDLDPGLLDRMRALARRNGRSIRSEVEHAFERHLAHPPAVRVETPPLPPAEVQPEKRKRGRPKKQGTG